MSNQAFGDLLRQHRKAAGLSQADLAERARLSLQAVSMLERGVRTHPRRHTVLSLGAALGLSTADGDQLLAAALGTHDGRLRMAQHVGVEHETVGAGGGLPPRSLPPAVADFTGREEQVLRIRTLLMPQSSAAAAPAIVVSAIEGMGGVGKTTLAVQVAHLVGDEFPDGQLYVNLRGFGPGEPMTPGEALGVLLSALGLPSMATGGIDHAVTRYRSVLAGKRLLVLLDNAAEVSQVLPLLPGTAGCAAIITSRRSLSTLPGARHLQLDVLPHTEAVALLAAITGDERVAAEPEAASQVVQRCGRLPLAIRMAASRLLARPQWPVSLLAEHLSDERRRLDELQHRDVDVRASFALSLRQLADSKSPLDNAAAVTYPLLCLPDCPDLGVTVAACLLGKSEQETERLLERLVDTYMLEAQPSRRYRLHDLLRTYGRGHADASLIESERAAALMRVLVLYNSVSWHVVELWPMSSQRKLLMDDRWVGPIPEFADKTASLEWLDQERPHLVAVVRQAVNTPGVSMELISQLAIGLLTYFSTRQHWTDLLEVSRLAVEVAVASHNRVSEAFAHNDLAAALTELGHEADAVTEMQYAVELFQSARYLPGEATSLTNLGYVLGRAGRLEDGARAAKHGLDRARELGDRYRIGHGSLVLGILHGRSGEREHELACIQESMECYRDIGHERGLAHALHEMGLVCRQSARHDDGLAALNECISINERLGAHGYTAAAHIAVADIYLELQRFADAAAAANSALSIAMQMAYPHAEAEARYALGTALAGLGRPAESRTEWKRALAIFEELGSARAQVVRASLETR